MGDDERFLRLLEPEYAKALAFARSLSRSRGEGDDLLQEACERALKALGKLRDDAAFRGWFYRIVINAHRTRTRRGFWRRFLPIAAEESAAVEDYRVATWSPDQAEAARRARQALARLPAVQREAIVLFEIEGWTVEEVAVVQGVSVSAVKSRLARGRERMRAFYERGAKAALATEEP
ncbi:MAG: RNA polymerase sigma factor [Kofleriaceae bacterium]